MLQKHPCAAAHQEKEKLIMKRKKVRNGLLTLMLMFAFMIGMSATAYAADIVEYVDHNDTGTPVVSAISAYTLVTSSMDTNWTNGWYVVQGDVTLSSISIDGKVHLILCDEAKLTVKNSIRVEAPNTLNIFGQRGDSGELVAEKPDVGSIRPGIGGGELQTAGTINIHGGIVTALGEGGSAGIGGAYKRNGGTVTIYGGTVTAIGANAVGIGGGKGHYIEHGFLNVGDGLAVYGGGGADDLKEVTKNAGGDYGRDIYMLVTKPFSHTHSFNYAAGTGDRVNTITATCNGLLECPQGFGKNPITLTLNEPSNLTYDACAKKATLSGYPDTAVDGLAAEPAVKYYQSTGSGSTQTSGAALDNAPVNVGDYVAQIKWGPDSAEAVANVAFSITPAPLTITAKDQTFTYNGKTQGEGDTVYADVAQIAGKVTVKGLQGSDELTSIVIDGQGTEIGEYPIILSGAAVGNATENYAITYVNGTLTIAKPKPQPKPTPPQPKPDPKPTPQPKINKAVAKIALDAGIIAKSSGSKVTASWGAVKGASSYVIYANYCDQKKLKKIRTVSGKTTSFDITKLNGKKFDPKKNLKFYVVAYKTVKGKKVKLAKSILAHAPGSKNSKRTNVIGVKVKKASFRLKKGKTAKIKAKLVLEKKHRKPLKHCAKFRYATSNAKVAKVSKKGKITAVGKGKCTVYVYAVSGVSKKIKVTVK